LRILLTTETVTPFTEKVAVPLLVGLLGLVSVVITAAVSTIGGRWAQATNRRRDAYAAAVKTLVAWAEFPYRIRRRTSDDPDELARLVGIGHDLQEQLRCHQTWITTESHWVAAIYRQAMAAITAQVAPACNDAWASQPIAASAGMNLGGWGPHDTLSSILRLQSAIACRFGWRRAAGLFGLHPGILPLPKEISTRISNSTASTASTTPLGT
jgi:hypothetical protein